MNEEIETVKLDPVASASCSVTANVSDFLVIQTMRRYGGSFVVALAEAAARADEENLNRIKQAWPEYWASYTAMANLPKSQNAPCERPTGHEH